jgi:hypothetical protein
MLNKATQASDQLVPYQTCLRTIGAALDARGDSHVRVFEVTSFPNGVGFASRRKLFSHKDLLAQDYGSHHHKPHLLHKHAAALSPYQDLFRAIGYELVDAGAYSIILDELDDGFLLTYQYYNPESGFMLHKRQIQLKRDDTRLILSVAIGRRSRR